jgi:hypothetical protein
MRALVDTCSRQASVDNWIVNSTVLQWAPAIISFAEDFCGHR